VTPTVGRRPRGHGGKGLPPYGLVGLNGWRSMPARSRPAPTARTSGCPRRRLTPSGLRGLDQGAADHAGRRRHPLASTSRCARSSISTSACARSAISRACRPGQGAGADRHGDLPRELRGHLRRHRVGGRHPEAAEGHRLSAATRWASRRSASPRPRASASSPSRAKAPSGWSRGDPVCHRQRPPFGDPGPQGQHHEVHRGRLPRLGLRAGPREFGAEEIDGGPWCSFKNPRTGREIVVKDVIADAFLQQILLRPGTTT
jgi:hypothetical protein